MNISVRCEYACRALLELANNRDRDEPLTVDSIARKRQIPQKFLIHILIQLKRAGILRSIRGASGGYLLAKAPETVTLLEIVEAVDGHIFDPLPAVASGSDEVTRTWQDVAKDVGKRLGSTTLRDVLNRNDSPSMYYI